MQNAVPTDNFSATKQPCEQQRIGDAEKQFCNRGARAKQKCPIDIHIILTFFPERKTKFLKKDQYPSKLSIIQLTSGDFRHKSARRVRTRYGTLNCTAARHYLQRASARSVRRQYLIACAPDH